LVSGTEPIILVPASRVYPQIITAPASPTTDQDVPDEALDSRDGSCNKNTRNTEEPVSPGHAEAPSSLDGDTQDMEQPDETRDSLDGSCKRYTPTQNTQNLQDMQKLHLL